MSRVDPSSFFLMNQLPIPASVFVSSGSRQISALCIQPEWWVYQALVALNETLNTEKVGWRVLLSYSETWNSFFHFEKNLGFNKYWQNTSPLSVAEYKAECCYDAYVQLRGPSLSGDFPAGSAGLVTMVPLLHDWNLLNVSASKGEGKQKLIFPVFSPAAVVIGLIRPPLPMGKQEVITFSLQEYT